MGQEGRDIGLANKLRAYTLQEHGLDTVDADGVLGFGADEREYVAAVEMLKALGVTRVRLLTNNPAKMEALRAGGIDVQDRRPLYGTLNRQQPAVRGRRRCQVAPATGLRTLLSGAPSPSKIASVPLVQASRSIGNAAASRTIAARRVAVVLDQPPAHLRRREARVGPRRPERLRSPASHAKAAAPPEDREPAASAPRRGRRSRRLGGPDALRGCRCSIIAVSTPPRAVRAATRFPEA